MARTFIHSDDMAVRIELHAHNDSDGDVFYTADCAGCGRDILADARERFNDADSLAEAERHADYCPRSAL